MFSNRQLACAVLSCVLVTGCASRATSLRSQPAVFMDLSEGAEREVKVVLPPLDAQSASPVTEGVTAVTPTLAATVASLAIEGTTLPQQEGTDPKVPVSKDGAEIAIKCVRTPDLLNSDMGSGKVKRPQCLYLSIDWQDVLGQRIRNEVERNRMVDLLLNVSDSNCTTFLSRVFANKAGLDATRNTGKDIATAIAAGTATVASGFSSGIGLFNLIGGTALDNLNSVLFSEKTFQVISSAVKTERLITRRALMEGKSRELANYSYLEALSDVQAYDQACSLQRGLERLAELASEKQRDEEKNLHGVRNRELEELRSELEITRDQRAADQQQLMKAQQELLAAAKEKDERVQAVLEAQVEALQKQIKESNGVIEKLREKISTATDKSTEPVEKPVAEKPASETKPASGG